MNIVQTIATELSIQTWQVEAVITTGKCIHADGRTWYEISAPVKGFMAGGMLGLQDDKYNR